MRKRILLGAFLAAPVLAAAAALPLSFQPGSKVWVEGTSTTRGWRCEATEIQGSAQAPTATLSELRSVPRGDMTLRLADLDCHNGTMNGHMRRAMKADEHPTIRFAATNIALTPGTDGTAVRMTGDLTLAGQTHPVTINATAVQEGGQLRVRGSKQITMTEWGVQPPSLMMGTMRVRPLATVGFDVVLKP